MFYYSLVCFQSFIEVLKVFIPLYLVFGLLGDLLWKKY